MGKFDELLQQEMTRKEFVSSLGLALLALIGLPSLIGVLTKTTEKKDANDGFGSGTYR